jgi:hypothetical protein
MNKNNLFQKGFIVPVLLGIIGFLIIAGGLYLYTHKEAEAPVVGVPIQQDNTGILGNKDDLVYFSVKAGDTVRGMLNLSGTVKGGYFFEGNIEVHLLDSNQNIIRSGPGIATADWMTVGPIPFTSTIDTLGMSGPGYIMLREDDPSGGEGGPAQKILIPVIFDNVAQETMTMQLFFPNRIFNPESLDCSLVYSSIRIVPKTQAVASAAISELIKGPTIEEEKNGYFGLIPEGTKVNSIKIENGILKVDFNKIVESGGGSCAQAAKVSSIVTTLKQFPTVKIVQISVEGNSNQSEIFQP